MKIYKFCYLLNGSVNISCLAPDEDTALKNVRRLFGEKESYQIVTTEYSHESGDYSVMDKVKKAAAISEMALTATQSKKKGDAMENVMDAYAAGKMLKGKVIK